MENADSAQLVDEILSALQSVGEPEIWVQQHLDGSVEQAVLDETFVAVTERLLGAQPPQAAHWEHLLVLTAARSSQRGGRPGFEACKAAVDKLDEMIRQDVFVGVSGDQAIALASAVTLILTAQSKLRQPIEVVVASLCEKFPDSLQLMAERCGDLWQRRGQMSGVEGLFVWDTRQNEWRLEQDFKAYRAE
ncbi:MAG: hypothetical protein IID44_30200 [Planctomycetes bacterium]|nr:hypothetical protein [Planctomycetota bacterium]